MTPPAPHLPPRSPAAPNRDHVTRLKWIGLLVSLSLISGTTASLLVFNYFYPETTAVGNLLYLVNRAPIDRGSDAPLAADVVRTWRYQIVRVYDETRLLSGEFYAEDSLLAQAVLLNAGGWSVMYAPDISVDRLSRAVGVDYQGLRYPIEKTLVDSTSGLVYVKFNGDEFHATTSFVNDNDLLTNSDLWGINANWKRITLGRERELGASPYAAAQATDRYEINEAYSHARVIINGRGELVGFGDKQGLLLPAWLVRYQLPTLLSGGALADTSVDWRGSFIEGMREGNVWKEVTGFYISDSRQLAQKNKVGKGDVVIRIQQEPVTRATLARQILAAPAQFIVTVLRSGKEAELVVDKTAKLK